MACIHRLGCWRDGGRLGIHVAAKQNADGVASVDGTCLRCKAIELDKETVILFCHQHWHPLCIHLGVFSTPSCTIVDQLNGLRIYQKKQHQGHNFIITAGNRSYAHPALVVGHAETTPRRSGCVSGTLILERLLPAIISLWVWRRLQRVPRPATRGQISGRGCDLNSNRAGMALVIFLEVGGSSWFGD
jgi:hypothetical protein